jgi:HEAT repeat protein
METGSDLLRAAAAQALTRFSGSRAVGAILAAMQPARGHFLQQLLSALLKIASPDVLRGLDQDIQERAFFSLMDALDDPSDEVKSDALRGLAVLGDLGSVYNILDLARRTETPEVVDLIKAALTGIGEIGPLVGAAAEGNPRVAETAIYVLGELGGDEAISAMVGALGHASDRVRRQAAGSLGKIGAQQAQAALVEAMNGEEDIEVLVEAATALGRLGDSMPVPALAALLTHADRGVREAALNALMAIGGPAARRVCIEGLSSKHPLRRGLCAQGLGMLGPGRDASHLAALLDDPEPEVRRRTVLALLASGDSQSLGFLRAALADPDAEVRLTLVKALALNYPAEGRDILIESLCDSDITVRLEAIAGLGRTRASQALEPLLDKLASGDAREKISAAVALGAMGSPEASEGLMGLLCDPNPKVRAAGAEAISRIQAGSWLALSKN